MNISIDKNDDLQIPSLLNAFSPRQPISAREPSLFSPRPVTINTHVDGICTQFLYSNHISDIITNTDFVSHLVYVEKHSRDTFPPSILIKYNESEYEWIRNWLHETHQVAFSNPTHSTTDSGN